MSSNNFQDYFGVCCGNSIVPVWKIVQVWVNQSQESTNNTTKQSTAKPCVNLVGGIMYTMCYDRVPYVRKTGSLGHGGHLNIKMSSY